MLLPAAVLPVPDEAVNEKLCKGLTITLRTVPFTLLVLSQVLTFTAMEYVEFAHKSELTLRVAFAVPNALIFV
jgi:hypothetical protein